LLVAVAERGFSSLTEVVVAKVWMKKRVLKISMPQPAIHISWLANTVVRIELEELSTPFRTRLFVLDTWETVADLFCKILTRMKEENASVGASEK
jgi:hypothetical protein